MSMTIRIDDDFHDYIRSEQLPHESISATIARLIVRAELGENAVAQGNGRWAAMMNRQQVAELTRQQRIRNEVAA